MPQSEQGVFRRDAQATCQSVRQRTAFRELLSVSILTHFSSELGDNSCSVEADQHIDLQAVGQHRKNHLWHPQNLIDMRTIGSRVRT